MFLNKEIQGKGGHCSREDCEATLRLFKVWMGDREEVLERVREYENGGKELLVNHKMKFEEIENKDVCQKQLH